MHIQTLLEQPRPTINIHQCAPHRPAAAEIRSSSSQLNCLLDLVATGFHTRVFFRGHTSGKLGRLVRGIYAHASCDLLVRRRRRGALLLSKQWRGSKTKSYSKKLRKPYPGQEKIACLFHALLTLRT